MEPSGGGMTDFGPGDLRGLRELGPFGKGASPHRRLLDPGDLPAGIPTAPTK